LKTVSSHLANFSSNAGPSVSPVSSNAFSPHTESILGLFSPKYFSAASLPSSSSSALCSKKYLPAASAPIFASFASTFALTSASIPPSAWSSSLGPMFSVIVVTGALFSFSLLKPIDLRAS